MGKTITTYLMTGDPKGPQYVLISNKLCKMIIIPRSNLSIIYEREELKTPSFYVLLGESDDAKPKAYIGETEDFSARVKNHDYKKDFWNKALIFVSIGGAMTKADVEYLEYKGIKIAMEENRYVLENTQVPKMPNLPEHQRDAMDEFFEDCVFLASFIGCSLFETEKEETSDRTIYYLPRNGLNARGVYTAEGFIVLRGSKIQNKVAKYFKGVKQRNDIIEQYCTEKDGELFMNADRLFGSPSAAACFCLGTSSNGWRDWKDKDGNTLDSLIRKI